MLKILKIDEIKIIPEALELCNDLHNNPDYLELFQEYQGLEAFYAYYFDDTGRVIIPFFKKPINDSPGYFDIISPWYLGGPFATCRAPFKAFLESFNQWCVDNNIVSEFHRLHPLLKNHELYNDNVFYDREVVYVDLSKPLNQIISEYDYAARKNIAKAERNGLEVIKGEDIKQQEAFIKVYTEAMVRKNTGKFYFFNKAFYDKLFSVFKNRLLLFQVKQPDKGCVCSSMELGSGQILYDYLRGTDPDSLPFRPNDVVLDKIIRRAKADGYRYFMIFGGNTGRPDDGQFRFKKSFSKTTASFYLYKKIHNRVKYDELCSLKGIKPDYEKAGFFPEYGKS